MDERTQDVADRMHSAAIHVLRRAAEQDRSSGLSPARLSALSVAVFRGPLTLGELAVAEGVRSATMSGIVNGLEADGLVHRRPHETDRRAVLIGATPSGRRVLGQARARRIETVAARLGDLSEDELALLRRAADVLEARFAPRT